MRRERNTDTSSPIAPIPAWIRFATTRSEIPTPDSPAQSVSVPEGEFQPQVGQMPEPRLTPRQVGSTVVFYAGQFANRMGFRGK